MPSTYDGSRWRADRTEERSRRRRLGCLASCTAAVISLAATPVTAFGAVFVARDGAAITVQGTGAAEGVGVYYAPPGSFGAGAPATPSVAIGALAGSGPGSAQTEVTAGPGCMQQNAINSAGQIVPSTTSAYCPSDGATSLTMAGADGDDTLSVSMPSPTPLPPTISVVVGGGPGRDSLSVSGSESATLLGEAGDDVHNQMGSAKMVADGGEGDDAFTFETPRGMSSRSSGGPGDDHFIAETAPGVEMIDGGAGNDLIEVNNNRAGDPDVVTCGAGRDTVRSNAGDQIARDCEGGASSAGATLVARRVVSASKAGVVSLRVKPGASASAGRIVLRTASRVRTAAGTRRVLTLGRARYFARPGRTRTVKIRLSSNGRALLKRLGRVRVKATMTVLGGRGRAKTIRFTLKRSAR